KHRGHLAVRVEIVADHHAGGGIGVGAGERRHAGDDFAIVLGLLIHEVETVIGTFEIAAAGDRVGAAGFGVAAGDAGAANILAKPSRRRTFFQIFARVLVHDGVDDAHVG